MLESRSGTYVLALRCRACAEVEVGRIGRLYLQRGIYLYTGSAFGPGGVAARVSRHCRRAKPRRWHLDYLDEHLAPWGIWYSYAGEHLEHQWAASLMGIPEFSPVPRFGCSDCRCKSHLFRSAENLCARSVSVVLGLHKKAFLKLC